MGIFTKKLKVFKVELERDPVAAGDVVKGKVVMELGDSLKLRGLHVEFIGYAWVMFRAASNISSKGYHFRSNQHYYSDAQVLFGKEKGKILGDNPVLEMGHHEFPFEFTLPGNAPPSAEFKHGAIRHQLKVTIDKPWKKDHVLRKPFTVTGRKDLNDDCPGDITERRQQTVGMFCCPAGDIFMEIHLSRAGFVPGEYIILAGFLKNDSSRRVKSYLYRLRQIVEFDAHDPEPCTHRITRVVAEVKRRKGVEPFQTVHLEEDALLIPPLPVSGLLGCTIMDCRYVLDIEMDSLHLGVPITIATIPPRDAAAVYSNHPYNPDWYNPKIPGDFPPPSSFLPAPVDNPPPFSYQQSMWDVPNRTQEEQEDKGKIKHDSQPWAPSYSYFKWN